MTRQDAFSFLFAERRRLTERGHQLTAAFMALRRAGFPADEWLQHRQQTRDYLALLANHRVALRWTIASQRHVIASSAPSVSRLTGSRSQWGQRRQPLMPFVDRVHPIQPLPAFERDRHEPFAVAFAPHPDQAVVQVNMVAIEPESFRHRNPVSSNRSTSVHVRRGSSPRAGSSFIRKI